MTAILPSPENYSPLYVPPSLTSRWTSAKLDPRQLAYLRSTARINYVYAGRRSFKTEAAKRRVVKQAIFHNTWPDARFFACAPVHQQAKDIFWEDIKRLVPDWAFKVNRQRSISDGELRIDLANGALIKVAGLDKPARIEGGFWDGGVISEYADCKADVFDAHIRPMMMRGGWIDLEGVPEGRNHFHEEIRAARLLLKDPANVGEVAIHHWKTWEVLHLWLGVERARAELKSMQDRMDPLTWLQECGAGFIHFQGMAYHCFSVRRNVKHKLPYDPNRELIFCFDFNVSPGVAVICQDDDKAKITNVIGEVHVPRNSNTPVVCRKLIEDWGKHKGIIGIYGDATGGADGTAKVSGSDWDLVRRDLRAHFGDRVMMRVPDANPKERARVNAMNSRLLTQSGNAHLHIDAKCTNLIKDFQEVRLLEGSAGEIDKKINPNATHMTDALGYFIEKRYPVRPATVSVR